MLGAIIGDIIGSRFEWHNIKTKEFELFTDRNEPTDDSMMTMAVASALISDNEHSLEEQFVYYMQRIGRKYPYSGYGGNFREWLYSDTPEPYKSWGNGSAMRVSPCGFLASSLEEAESLAELSAAVTHNHQQGIKGARATAAAVFLAKTGKTMQEIKDYISEKYYATDFTLDDIRPDYDFDVSCQGSVPPALEAFYESEDYVDAIRNAVSIGGDSDTIAAITGGIAEAYYGIPEEIKAAAMAYLDPFQTKIVENYYGVLDEIKSGKSLAECTKKALEINRSGKVIRQD